MGKTVQILARPIEVLDDAAGNSKVFTFPAGTTAEVMYAWVDNTSIATVGNRQLALEILDASNNLRFVAPAGALQAASLQRFFAFGPNLPALAAFIATSYLTIPIPHMLRVAPGFKVRIRDMANIAAGDTLKAYLYYAAQL